MEYQEYISLGFKRTELNCVVEYKQTGYYGFSLSKNINKKMMVVANSGELDKPKLYIKKRGIDNYHIMPISPEVVGDLFKKEPITFDFSHMA